MDEIFSARTALLRALMRWRRSHLRRVDVGLQPRRGSRAGLTQDDLAELTGYSVRVISQLEHGRLRTPPPELLDAVAAGLRMTPDERRTLWVLAVGAVPPAPSYATDRDGGLARLLDQLYPHPAYLTDAAWNVHAYNRGVTEWFVDFASVPPADRNIAKWIFFNPHAQHVMVAWERDFADVFIARMRAVAAKFPDDQRLNELVTEMRTRSAYFDQSWLAEGAVYVDQATETRVFRRPGYTDPDQANDSTHHVAIDMVILSPLRPGDERRIVTFLLPSGELHRPDTLSAEACTACARKR